MVELFVVFFVGFYVVFLKKIIMSVELIGLLKFIKDIGNLYYDVLFICLNEKFGFGIEINEDIL